MKVRSILLATTVLLLLMAASAHAESTSTCQVYDNCGDPEQVFQTDGGGYNGSFSVRCTDSYGCILCGMNPEKTMSVCVRLPNAMGHCLCGDPQPIPPNGFPRCSNTGSCLVR